MDPIAIVMGLVLGVPLAALAYWYTRRNQKLGYGSGLGGDYTSSGGHSGGGGDGSDSSS